MLESVFGRSHIKILHKNARKIILVMKPAGNGNAFNRIPATLKQNRCKVKSLFGYVIVDGCAKLRLETVHNCGAAAVKLERNGVDRNVLAKMRVNVIFNVLRALARGVGDKVGLGQKLRNNSQNTDIG